MEERDRKRIANAGGEEREKKERLRLSSAREGAGGAKEKQHCIQVLRVLSACVPAPELTMRGARSSAQGLSGGLVPVRKLSLWVSGCELKREVVVSQPQGDGRRGMSRWLPQSARRLLPGLLQPSTHPLCPPST